MPTVSFSGAVSGIDSDSIIKQLVQIEKLPAGQLEKQKVSTNRRISSLGEIVTKLKALDTKAKAIDKADELHPYAVTSSSDKMKVSVSGTTSAQTHSLVVTSLARTQTSQSKMFATTTAGVVGTGSVSLTVGTAAPVAVAFSAADSLSAIAARITSTVAGAAASVLYDGSQYRLVVTGSATGAANTVTFSAETGESLAFTTVQTAANAVMTLDGISVSRAANTFTDLIAGVKLELNDVSTSTIKVQEDTTALRDRVKGFVDSYNDVANLLKEQLGGTKKGPDSLFGDSTVQGLQRRLAVMISASRPHGASTISLGKLGMKIESNGTITFDASKFDAAVAKDATAVEHLFVGSGVTTALSGAVTSAVTTYTTGITGVLPAKQDGLRKTVRSYDKQIARIESRAESLETRLRRQYTALEENMTRLQGQMAYVNSLFSK